MASALRRLFVVFFLTYQTTCSVITSGSSEKSLKVEDLWGQLEIKPNPFLTMPYRDFRVPIYEHRDNNLTVDSHPFYLNRFFYSPVPILDSSSVKITENSEILFRIELWNSRLERDVALYLKDAIGKEIKLHQLQIVPFERLFVAGQSVKLWKKYELEKMVWFSLDVKKVKSDPKFLTKHLTLKFSTDSAFSLKERLMVNVEELTAAMKTYRLAREEFSQQYLIYVTHEALERMIAEAIDYIETEVLHRQQILMSESLLRKQLNHFLATKVSKEDVNFDYVYKMKKDITEKDEDQLYEDYDKLLSDDVSSNDVSYYAISFQSLESTENLWQPVDVVCSLAMMTLSVKENDTSIFRKEDDYVQKEIRDMTSDMKKQFTDFERQLRYQVEKTKEELTRNSISEMQKIKFEIVKMKSRTCPMSIGSQSYCEGVPFFGCYCFSIDKRRHHHEAASLCKENGMKLISLDTRIEKDQFVAIIERERKLKELMFWTSGTRVHSSTKTPSNKGVTSHNSTWGWVWTGSGKPITNWNWMPYEPEKREGHDYVVINYPTRYYQTYPANALLYTACETRFGWPVDF